MNRYPDVNSLYNHQQLQLQQYEGKLLKCVRNLQISTAVRQYQTNNKNKVQRAEEGPADLAVSIIIKCNYE